MQWTNGGINKPFEQIFNGFSGLDDENYQWTISQVNRTLAPLLSHARGRATIGVNVGGQHYSSPSGSGNPFSNLDSDSQGRWWPSQTDLDFIASTGIGVVRIGQRWERLQPTLNAALDSGEVAALTTVMDNAHTAGLKVVIEIHNYGYYYIGTSGGSVSTGYAIGSAQVTNAYFSNLWTRMCAEFSDHPALYGYELMNEPGDMISAAAWETSSQAAVTAIRGVDTTSLLLVPGYQYSKLFGWRVSHPDGWITDPNSNFCYVAHNYWSTSASGDGVYDLSYADEMANIIAFTWARSHKPTFEFERRLQLGESTLPRNAQVQTAALASGELRLTYFTAAKTETIDTVTVHTGSVTTSGVTISRIGIYKVLSDGSLVLVSSSTNDTSLMTAASTAYAKAVTAFKKRRGITYAVGVLQVHSGGTGPTLVGQTLLTDTHLQEPVPGAVVTGQANLPSTIAQASLANNPNLVLAELTT
jgi:hypothetical protein